MGGAPGGSESKSLDGKLQPLHKMSKPFLHGHDLYVDAEGAIYLGEWNANRPDPTKLPPVKQKEPSRPQIVVGRRISLR